jgi:hypothetical protein
MAGETNHSPYAPNFEGVVGALLDFKDTSPSDSAFKLFGVELTCFENVTQGCWRSIFSFCYNSRSSY